MQRDQQNEVTCSTCSNKMPESRIHIHKLKCQMQRESKILKSNLKQKKQSKIQRRKIFKFQDKQYQREQQMQKIPCTYCGYRQTYQQLDSHPLKCPGIGKNCQFCQDSYPSDLLEQHKQVCEKRPHIQSSSSQSESIQIQHRSHRGPVRGIIRFMEMMNQLMQVLNEMDNEGMTPQQIKKLKTFKYKSKKQDQLCTICYCNLEDDQTCIELNCKHNYHTECIQKWLQKSTKCPVCKGDQMQK